MSKRALLLSFIATTVLACTAESGIETGATQSDLSASFGARHCELFVDRVEAMTGSFGYEGVRVYLKVLPERLDSLVEEVGFHHRRCHESTCDEWVTDRFSPHQHATDYFQGAISVYSWRSGASREEGVFYVRTRAGTRYWLNSHGNPGENFSFDRGTFAWLERRLGAKDHPVATQVAPELAYLNPDRCY